MVVGREWCKLVYNYLIELSLRVQILPMVKEMKAFVPEFKSQNSRFEELD